MVPEFKAAMFDMDGTVLRTMRYWRLTTVELLLGYNIIPTPEQMARVFSSSSRALCMEVLAEHGIYKDQWEILRELEGYMHHHYLQDATEKPGVREYLEKLRRSGIPMCIATAAPRDYAREALERLKLAEYFEFITDCYEQEMRKDNPEFFHRMARRLGVETREMCVFEDALYAIRGAKDALCPVIAVRDSTQAHAGAEIEQLADHCISEYGELLQSM